MSQSLVNASIFLITTLFDLYLMVLGVRLILAWERANYFNPITRFIITITQPVIAPLRRMIPNAAKIEFSTLFFIILLELVKLSLIVLILQKIPQFSALSIIAMAATIKLILGIFFYSIIIYAIMTWFAASHTPIFQVVAQLSQPILRPLGRIMPPISGFDLSPLFALIILQVLMIFL